SSSDAAAWVCQYGAGDIGLLRCIFSNPYRPLVIEPVLLAWNDGIIPSLAQSLYESRQMPEGTLDPDRLAVLADAVEDAGCDNADILTHLRGPLPHVRGCWVLDLILMKD